MRVNGAFYNSLERRSSFSDDRGYDGLFVENWLNFLNDLNSNGLIEDSGLLDDDICGVLVLNGTSVVLLRYTRSSGVNLRKSFSA